MSTATCRAPAGDLLPAVVPAGGLADRVVGLDDLGIHDADAGLEVPPLMRGAARAAG